MDPYRKDWLWWAGVVEDFLSNTYRVVYIVKFGEAVYILHVFQKKSSSGITTLKHELDKIHARLKAAENHAKRA